MTTRDAEQTARNAEQSTSNGVGMCLQWSRQRANIPALQPDAATAWRHAFHRHPGDRNPPRGAMVYWTGGSKGFGHIAVALGNGRIRSSDSGGSGKPATVDLDWPTRTWGMPYAGWADNVNDRQIPGVGGDDEMNDADWKKLRSIVADEVSKMPAQVWNLRLDVDKPDGKTKTKKAARQMLREILQRVQS